MWSPPPPKSESLPYLGRGMRTGMARRRADRDEHGHSLSISNRQRTICRQKTTTLFDRIYCYTRRETMELFVMSATFETLSVTSHLLLSSSFSWCKTQGLAGRKKTNDRKALRLLGEQEQEQQRQRPFHNRGSTSHETKRWTAAWLFGSASRQQ